MTNTYEIEMIEMELRKLHDDELVKIVNSQFGNGMSCDFKIYNMEELDWVCGEHDIYATELIENLGNDFNTCNKYFQFSDGSYCASELISFNSVVDHYGEEIYRQLANDIWEEMPTFKEQVQNVIKEKLA